MHWPAIISIDCQFQNKFTQKGNSPVKFWREFLWFCDILMLSLCSLLLIAAVFMHYIWHKRSIPQRCSYLFRIFNSFFCVMTNCFHFKLRWQIKGTLFFLHNGLISLIDLLPQKGHNWCIQICPPYLIHLLSSISFFCLIVFIIIKTGYLFLSCSVYAVNPRPILQSWSSAITVHYNNPEQICVENNRNATLSPHESIF